MSTNLKLRNNFPQIRLPEIRIRTSTVAASYNNNKAGCEIGGGGGELEACRTPTSAENKIPEISICPPAPRKPKRKADALSCKRKLFGAEEFQFFEIANREEVETFFRSSFERIPDSSPATAKRRCKSCT